jgi:hypothetical protein
MMEFKPLKTEADFTEALKPLALDQDASLFLSVMKKPEKQLARPIADPKDQGPPMSLGHVD